MKFKYSELKYLLREDEIIEYTRLSTYSFGITTNTYFYKYERYYIKPFGMKWNYWLRTTQILLK